MVKKTTHKKVTKKISKKKDVKKQSHEKPIQKEQVTKETKLIVGQKFKGIALMLIGLVLLGAISTLLYTRLFKARPLADYLPAEKTFALLEVNIKNNELDELSAMLNKYPVYQHENLIQHLNNFLQTNYDQDIAPWLGRKIGLALMQTQNSDNTDIEISPILFAEIKNFQQSLAFFESKTLENGETALKVIDYEGQSMYEYPLGQNIYFAYLDSYLIASTNSVAVKNLIDSAVNSSSETLINSEKYNRIANNLPNSNIAFGFFDLANLTKYILKSPNFISENGFILTSFEPFLTIFDAEGFSINKEDHGLKVRTYTAFNRDLLEAKEFFTFKGKYRATLAKYVSDDVLLVWGGVDLEKQLKKIADILGKGNEASLVIFDGILEAQKDLYFGKEVSLKDDVYPLVKNEFLIAIRDGDVPMVELVLELQDEADEQKVRKIVEGFVKENAMFKPEIREVTLEDGTKGQEIIGVPEDVVKSEEQYNNHTIHAITLGGKPWGIYYLVEDKILTLATAKELIQNVIDSNKPSLADSDDFKKNIEPILSHADEISFVNLKKLIPHIWPTVEDGGTGTSQLYLDPFKSISSSKNYFTDGISSIHYIEIN